MLVPGGDCATGRRRRRIATIAVAALAIGIVGPVVLNEVSAAGASIRPAVVPHVTTTTVPHAAKKGKITVGKTARHNRKRKRVSVRVARPTTTTSTSRSTTSTTSTTVARNPSPSSAGRGRSRRVGGAIATQPVSAHNSGMSTSTMILLLLGIAPLILLGFGLVYSDLSPPSSRARRRDSGVTSP